MVPNVLVNPRRNPAYLQQRGDNILQNWFKIQRQWESKLSAQNVRLMYINVHYITVARFNLVCQTHIIHIITALFMCLSLRKHALVSGLYNKCHNLLLFFCLIILNLNIFGFCAAGPDKTHMWSHPFGPLGNWKDLIREKVNGLNGNTHRGAMSIWFI